MDGFKRFHLFENPTRAGKTLPDLKFNEESHATIVLSSFRRLEVALKVALRT